MLKKYFDKFMKEAKESGWTRDEIHQALQDIRLIEIRGRREVYQAYLDILFANLSKGKTETQAALSKSEYAGCFWNTL